MLWDHGALLLRRLHSGCLHSGCMPPLCHCQGLLLVLQLGACLHALLPLQSQRGLFCLPLLPQRLLRLPQLLLLALGVAPLLLPLLQLLLHERH